MSIFQILKKVVQKKTENAKFEKNMQCILKHQERVLVEIRQSID